MNAGRVLPAVLAVLLLAGCANDLIGRREPDCNVREQVTGEIVLQAQAVPTATVGPCIDDLPPGWDYEHQEAESGLARFWLSSDLLGHRFVEVSLRPSCDPGTAIRRPSPAEGIDAFLTGSPYVEPVRVTLVPASDRVVPYAASIGVELSRRTANGRPFDLVLSDAFDPAVAVAEAIRAGRIVIAVGDLDAAEGTVELLIPGGEGEEELSLDHAVDEIEEQVGVPRYDADWYFQFEGGCIVWDFHASGEMVDSVDEDMQQAVGFYDLGGLRRQMNELGYYTGP